jgi:TPR repeat protein
MTLLRHKIPAIIAAVLTLSCASLAVAATYEDGLDAYYKGNYELAKKLWEPLAAADDARAQAGLAKLYYSGLGVLHKDYAGALYWGEKAARNGEARAQYVLGTMYREGEGVKKDLPRAVGLLQKAADQNHPWAQYDLGLMYDLGEGVPHDRVVAYKWLTLAVLDRKGEDAQVVGPASFLLEKVASKMNADAVAEAKRQVREWTPAHDGKSAPNKAGQ